MFHCVHSDTLYVKNRRNKSEEKKNKTATVKILYVKKKHVKKTKKKKNCYRKTKPKTKKKMQEKKEKKLKRKTKKTVPKKKTLATVNFLRVLIYYLINTFTALVMTTFTLFVGSSSCLTRM